MNENNYPNKFKAAMLNQERRIGCFSALASPITTEILGLAGFDWILLDGEHAPNDVQTFIPQLMALKDSVSAPMVRLPQNDTTVIKRLLDIGFYNLLVPFVESKEQAEYAVAATRYPPQGVRGVSVGHRSNGYGTITDYFQHINDNICVVVQIESQLALDNLDEILAVDGVDGVFVGPSDLAAALGHLGNPGHPDVQAAIKEVFEKGKAKGKSIGILAPVYEDAQRYIEWGANLVAVGSDLGAFRSATQALCQKFVK